MNATMNKACPENEIFVKAMLGELPEDGRRDFLSHISTCPGCRLKFEALAKIETQLKAREDHIPETLCSTGGQRTQGMGRPTGQGFVRKRPLPSG